MEGLARQEPDIIPLYMITPKGIRSFVDIYRAIVDGAIEANLLAAAGRDLFDRTGGQLNSDVGRAIIRIGMYPEEEGARMAVSWLRAEKVSVRDLKDIGLSQRIETSADAIEALNQLIRVLQREGSVKVLLLIDEVQDLADLGKRLTECIGGLHKVFDRNPDGLTMVMSFTTASQPALKGIIGETLFDRASDVLTLPALSQDEAIEMVEGLLREWSLDPSTAPAPFTRDAIVEVVKHLAAKRLQLTPRALIKPFNKILREADLDIADGELDRINQAYAAEHLSVEEEEESQ
jgi:hypothetical protein